MRLLQKIFIFFLLLTLPLSVNSAEPEVLYLWQISSGHEWESYGDENVQQKYEGITSNGEPDGKGILSFPDGKRVTGEWKNGNEWNTDHFNNEGKLIGRTAKGKYIIGAGEKIKMVLFLRKVSGRWGWHEEGVAGKDYKYEGTIENGKPNGSGIYTTPSGNQYIGDFKDGKKHGRGIFTYTSGSKYEGEFKEGKKHGQGTYTLPNGSKYVGEWRENKSWKGTEYDKNGNVIGKFVNEVKKIEEPVVVIVKKPAVVVKKSYTGVLFRHWENRQWRWFRNGNEKKNRKYVGDIENGGPNGQGTLTFPDGRKYVGGFKHWVRNGQGTLTKPNGDKYVGEYKDGERHGQGTYTWSDGRKYVGEYKDGEPWNGTYDDKDGKIIFKYVNGVLQK